MLFSLYYLFVALLLFSCAFLLDNIFLTFLIDWFALNFLLVALAYVLNKPQIFRKKQNGRLPFYVRWLFIPFLICIRLYNLYARYHDPVPALQQVDRNLYLARRLLPSDAENLKEQGITAILDVTAEFNALDFSILDEDVETQIEYLNIPVLDHSVPSKNQLLKALNWLHKHQADERSVVVHCALGRGRSVFVVMAYMLSQHPEATIEEVMTRIQQVRATARLNKKQNRRLKQFQKAGLLSVKNKACLIVNPVSGGQKWDKYKLEIFDLLSPYFDFQIKYTSESISGETLAQQALKENFQILIACGGDGTVTQVASQLINTKAKLGIIPLGTTNALSHALWGISSKVLPIESACMNIIEGYSCQIDTAKCNEKLVLLLAGLGFEHTMIEQANREKKNALGQFAYLQGLWNAIGANKSIQLAVQFDEEAEQKIDVTSLTVANAAPFTSLLAQGKGAPDLRDGELDVTWIPASDAIAEPILSMFELAISGVTETHYDVAVKHKQVKKIKISSETECHYVIDGEVFKDKCLEVVVQPTSLNVFVPQSMYLAR
ncbi:diacylglycerol kinase family protein [Catenovulum sediminis]|uniref:Diacylglycerol kinase family protein n=1 Tax=Catenovulum sediminis TaxID=1740262 RepID=A0ABV1RH37_9ALTE|nr:diacylglycerol kinase family protein [Catenovulum sediminis]